MSQPLTSQPPVGRPRTRGSGAPDYLDNPVARRSRWIRWGALAAVVIVPLAFVGLTVGALSQGDDALGRIPAAIVNNDVAVDMVGDDGTTTPALVGRQLVTELTGADEGFDWVITSEDEAKDALAAGDVYAIITVPEDFSKAILAAQDDDSRKADLSIQTDDAHSYLTGTLAQVVGETMVSTFGAELTKQTVSALYTSFGTLGDSLADAADGADQLADGADQLADGATQLADGTTQLGDGAGELADGARQVASGTSDLGDGLDDLADGAAAGESGAKKFTKGLRQYTGGVGSLSDGLGELAAGDDALTDLSTGLTGYTDGVSELSGGLTRLNDILQQYPTIDPALLENLQAVTDGLETAAAGGGELATGAADGISAIQSGISGAADGAATLDASSADLVDGARGLASGYGDIADGAAGAADGADQLAEGASGIADGADGLQDGAATIADGISGLGDGATGLSDGASELADGLTTGAESLPDLTDDQIEDKAEVTADPVTLAVSTDHKVDDLGQGIATFFVPLSLWFGAIAVFLVLRPAPRRSLASTATNGRLVVSGLARAGLVTGLQAVLLVALLHIALGVAWSLLPWTLLFTLVTAFAFTAIHYLLVAWLGRAGLVLSIVLIGIQLVATGNIYPLEILSAPFRAISPFLPLTYGVQGMQAIISGSGAGGVIGAAVVLVIFGVASVLLSLVAIRRTRRASALGLVPAPV